MHDLDKLYTKDDGSFQNVLLQLCATKVILQFLKPICSINRLCDMRSKMSDRHFELLKAAIYCQDASDTDVQQVTKVNSMELHNDAELMPPSLYKVIMKNDDYTPMDFVVQLLIDLFGKNREAAHQIMMTIHHEGEAVCGVYSREIAETKSALVIHAAKGFEYPLVCVLEPEGGF